MKNVKQSLILSLVIIICFITDLSAKGSLIIRNARLIDGTDNQMQDGVSILIYNGKISKISKNISAQGIPQLDVKGSYVLPGIIDGHVHLTLGPGLGLTYNSYPKDITEWKNTSGKYISQYLRAYLACGVTTVLDAHADTYVIQEIRRYLSKDVLGPRFLTLGEFFAPPNGYPPNKLVKPVSSREEVEAKLDAMQSLGVTGIKVSIEKGWMPFANLQRHSKDILDVIKHGALRRNLPVFVHASSEEDFNTALDINAHALMHTLTSRGREQLSEKYIERMSKTNTYQVSTLSPMDVNLISYNPDRLNEPLLEIVVPKSELLRARDPIAVSNIRKLFTSELLPWLPNKFLDFLSKKVFSQRRITESLHNSQKAIFDLHKAGVPIVMGSDTVYGIYAIYSFHGFTSLREIELLGEAGLSPKEVIKAATVNPAKMLGLGREIGTIEIGKCADLIVLKDNPLNDLKAFKTIRWTIKDGIAKTPKEWMSQ